MKRAPGVQSPWRGRLICSVIAAAALIDGYDHYDLLPGVQP
jgi:hypothetical protein